ncbi:nicotinamidase-related amidase [Psychromicrobium silvestre]|uniref:Nicotinamidase-related amidase n=1 Tax=Psychromicrobium silvestre TaxID=1645614 RepID=A0A7Y9S7R7_9MICC|nr:isochorismatase family protein [Psychromicrobium silvestre]NYE95825.1 nicotinamidase-related amidase [Psychromicrobium silvestre]
MKALLVIDVQESFRQRESWSAASNPEIAEQVARLVDHARAKGDAVIWIIHSEPGSGGVFDPELGFTHPIEGLEPAAGEVLFTKTSHNAFTTTGLQQYLVSQGIDELQICGIRTEQCCETTARLGSDLGYSVEFVVDATATEPIEHWSAPAGRSLKEILADPLTLDAESIIQRTCYALARRFAVIRTVDEVLAG